jgi:hypothetical protein
MSIAGAARAHVMVGRARERQNTVGEGQGRAFAYLHPVRLIPLLDLHVEHRYQAFNFSATAHSPLAAVFMFSSACMWKVRALMP